MPNNIGLIYIRLNFSHGVGTISVTRGISEILTAISREIGEVDFSYGIGLSLPAGNQLT